MATSKVPSNFWDARISDIPQWWKENVTAKKAVRYPVTLIQAYRNKYILCPKMTMRPFFHFIGALMVFHYWVDVRYKGLRKNHRLREYH